MAQPIVGVLAQAIYDEVKIIQPDDEARGWPLLYYIAAITDVLFQPIDDLVADGPNGEPGWSILVDLDRIPDYGLDYLAQFIGVQFPVGLTNDQKRQRIADTDGWNRGTRSSLIGAVLPYLTGAKTVVFRERRTSAYTFEVITYTSQTPDSAAVLAALQAQKPAGLVMTYNVRTGQDYQSVYTNRATYGALYSAYATYEGVIEDQPGT